MKTMPRSSGMLLQGLALLVTIAVCSNCTTASHLIVSHDEYSAYRKVRTSTQLDKRLAASHAYLSTYPSGRWARSVKPWFDRAELRYWLLIRDTPSGLATYMQTLPDGPHAKEATDALLAYRERQAAARKELLDLRAAMTEQRLNELALQREEAMNLFTAWLGRFLAIESWGQTTSHLPHDTIFAWRIDPPQGTCHDDRCIKSLHQPYQVPGGGEEADRLLVLDIEFLLKNGMLHEARLRGPALFSRLFEVGAKRNVRPERPADRIDAIAFSLDVISGAIEARLPANRCTLPAVANVVLHRSCDGWTVQAIVADSAEDDDIVSIIGPGSSDSPSHGDAETPAAASPSSLSSPTYR